VDRLLRAGWIAGGWRVAFRALVFLPGDDHRVEAGGHGVEAPDGEGEQAGEAGGLACVIGQRRDQSRDDGGEGLAQGGLGRVGGPGIAGVDLHG
jgi:hypothetical protein